MRLHHWALACSLSIESLGLFQPVQNTGAVDLPKCGMYTSGLTAAK